jgi:branched-chain amino acid transport system substrate-binding protein
VFGEVKSGKVVYAYQEDQDKGADLRLKDKKAAVVKK